MKLLLIGSTGLIGTKLKQDLKDKGYRVDCLFHSYREHTPNDFCWNYTSEKAPLERFEGYDVVINLAGESVGKGRWNKIKKEKIYSSRIDFTHSLVEIFKNLNLPPKLYMSASAIGYYGDSGDNWVTEESPSGQGFLPELCCLWEKQLEALEMRTVSLRFGVILSTKGGALTRMLPPFRLGLGGKVGTGKQYMSWVSLRDAVQSILFIMEQKTLTGAINIVSPNSCKNIDFTKTLGKVLHRPTLCPFPAFMVKLLLGEMGETLLLASSRVKPSKLLQEKFPFQDVDLQKMLESELLTSC